MSSIELVLRKKPNKRGKYPITIRITKDRKSAFIHLGHYVGLDEWDDLSRRVKKSHPNSVRINNFIRQKLTEATDDILDFIKKNKKASTKAIKEKIKPTVGPTFFPQADLYLDNLKAAGRQNEYVPNKTRIERFKKFVKTDISFEDFTVSLLERFKVHVKTEYKVGDRTVQNHLSALRSVFSSALREKVVTKEMSPFGKEGVVIKFPETAKIGLELHDIENLEKVELKNKPHHTRNIWLISYYFAGMRISDVLRLRWSDFQNGRLYYGMSKNDKFDSLKIPAKAQKILDQYIQLRENQDDLVFPDLKGLDLSDEFNTEKIIGYKASNLDQCLRKSVVKKAGISKKMSMHIARHTFAQLAGDQIPLPILQRLYRHSSIITTMGYQSNFTTKDTDEALDKVLRKENNKKLLVPEF